MLDTVALDQQACLFKLHPASLSKIAPDQQSLPQGQQTYLYLPLHMFDNAAQDQDACLKPSNFFCNSFTRLAGLLQQTLLLNSRHVCYSCTQPSGMSVTIALYKHVCLLELNLTSIYDLQAHL